VTSVVDSKGDHLTDAGDVIDYHMHVALHGAAAGRRSLH
jgi:hypothetical protein